MRKTKERTAIESVQFTPLSSKPFLLPIALILLAFCPSMASADVCCMSCLGQHICGCSVQTACGMCVGCGMESGWIRPHYYSSRGASATTQKSNYYEAVVSRETPFVISTWRTSRWAGILRAKIEPHGSDEKMPSSFVVRLDRLPETAARTFNGETLELLKEIPTVSFATSRAREGEVEFEVEAGVYVMRVDWAAFPENMRLLSIDAYTSLSPSAIGPSIIPEVEDPDR